MMNMFLFSYNHCNNAKLGTVFIVIFYNVQR